MTGRRAAWLTSRMNNHAPRPSSSFFKGLLSALGFMAFLYLGAAAILVVFG